MEVRKAIGPLVRTLAQINPVSACLATAWNEYETKKANERLDYLFKVLNNEIKIQDGRYIELQDRISNGKYTAQYIESVARSIVHEASEIKQELYGRILSNCLIESNISDEEKLNAISTLDSLFEIDIEMLKRFGFGKSIRVEDLVPASGNSSELGKVIAVLSKLESRGLIGESDSGDGSPINMWVGNENHWTNRWNNKYFSILPFGKTFLGLLSSHASPSEHISDDKQRHIF
jgi:hypothetical protein